VYKCHIDAGISFATTSLTTSQKDINSINSTGFDMFDHHNAPHPSSRKTHHNSCPTMPLPVEDQFPEADASTSAQASSSSSSAAQPPRPKISDPKHLSSLLDMLADGEGDDEAAAGTAPGPGGIQVEEIESEDEDEVEQGEEGKGEGEGAEGVGSSTSKSKKKKKNKRKNKSGKAVDKLKCVGFGRFYSRLDRS
jgi:hypothetical protein